MLVCSSHPTKTVPEEGANVRVVIPTDPPNIETVEFQFTSTYHWPTFNLNVTDEFGNPINEGFDVVNGPSLFKQGISLSGDQVRNINDTY